MRDLTEYMSGTPFKNSTFRFVATDHKDIKRDFYYTPHQITNWHYDKNPQSMDSVRNFVHDISHIIDLYQRGETARLLRTDFGWKLMRRKDRLHSEAILTELRTITIQDALCKEHFGHTFGRNAYNYWRHGMSKLREDPQFLRGRGAFDACVDEIIAKSEKTGVEGYMKVWKAACNFVAKHREDEAVYVGNR